MDWKISWFLCFFVLAVGMLMSLVSDIDVHNPFFLSKHLDKPELDLAICILSARDNFGQRDALRKSWMKDLSNQKCIIAKFVVGIEACPHPPQSRIDNEGCELWTPEVPTGLQTEGLPVFTVTKSSKTVSLKPVLYLYVKVLHDMILQRVGLAEIISLNKIPLERVVEVVLYDSVTEEELTKAAFSENTSGRSHKGYRYRNIRGLRFTKGFEFLVVLELNRKDKNGDMESNEYLDKWLSKSVDNEDNINLVQSHNNLLKIEYSRNDGTQLPNLKNSKAHFLPLVSFMFSTLDSENLASTFAGTNKHASEWKNKNMNIKKNLEIEQKKYGDLLMVNSQDYYRNLPDKLLQCHSWLEENFNTNYVMKTDDDVWVNIKEIIHLLKDESITKGMWWWGKFRRDWMVERHGKWREPKYSPSVYPPFACGSGNIMSGRLHRWIANNKDHLRRFQGEDVSMGIWLSGVEVEMQEDHRWSCDHVCGHDSLVIAQLSTERVVQHWRRSQECGSPCSAC